MYKTILVAVDINHSNIEILKKAMEIARTNHAELVIAHVNQIAITDPTFESSMSNVFYGEDEQMISKELEKLRALAYAGGLRNISLLTKSSTNVSYTITHEMYDQEKYDLIVCGNSNKNGLEKLLLGSVAKNITKDAKTDVFVVKT